MNQLALDRLVEVTSDEMIDSLEPRCLVYVKNSVPRVFDRKEGDFMVFYYSLSGKDVSELKTPRNYLGNSGNMVSFMMSHKDQRKELTPEDGDYYRERKNDLVSLGLMKN